MEKWRQFEAEVVRLYELKGYAATPDIRVAGRQNDIILEADDETVQPILIECKYHDERGGRKVGVEDVEAFVAKVNRFRGNGRIGTGVLVTNTGFTADAAGALDADREGRYVHLRTLAQVKRRLVNFDRYISRLVDDYESEDLESTYQPLLAKSPARSASNAGDAVSQLRSFIEAPGSRVCVLTGDYGTGKTTVVTRLAYLLAKETLDSEPARIPLYIPLKWYTQAGGSGALLQRFLSEHGLVHTSVDSLLRMNRDGHFVLILDGFDEMLRRSTRQSRRDSMQDLVDLSDRKTKIILTGRPGYFEDEAELESPLLAAGVSGIGARMGKSRVVGSKARASLWERYELLPLSPAQIRQYLDRKLMGPVKSRKRRVDSIVNTIESTYNLADLAQRPILLDMIMGTLDHAGSDAFGSPAQLYRSYVDQWLELDELKGASRTLISPDRRLSFSIALAWILQDQNEQEIHYRRLQTMVGEFYGIEEAEELDHFSGDVRTSTFLQRDDEGRYRFAHLSFQEYFCARFLVEPRSDLAGLLKGVMEDPDLTLLELAQRSSAVLDFVGDMLECPVSPYYWRYIRDGLAGYQERIQKAAERLGVPLAQGALEGVVQMADGDGTAFDMAEMASAYRSTYQSLVRVIGTMADERIEPWMGPLLDALARGRLTKSELASVQTD